MSFKRGDLVLLRADRIYESYGKQPEYYIVLKKYQENLISIHGSKTKDTIAVFEEDLILLSSV